MSFAANVARRMTAALATIILLGFPASRSDAVPLFVDAPMVLAAGTYAFDSVTIAPTGSLSFTGSARVTLNVTGDVRLLSEVTSSIDPETGDTVVSVLRGSIGFGSLLIVADGSNGIAGMDGVAGFFQASPGSLANLQIASSGGPGGEGASPGFSSSCCSAPGLTINAGNDIFLDGDISLSAAAAGGYGGSGGAGGTGGRGLDTLGLPTNPPGNELPLAREYANAGNGGAGGNGAGGAGFTGGPNLILNAGGDFVLGPHGELFLSAAGGAAGGSGGTGGTAGLGGRASAPTDVPQRAGDNGSAGDGGSGGAAGSTGDVGAIYIQAESISLDGTIEQSGYFGGQGGAGGAGGSWGTGLVGEGGLHPGDGGDGGQGGRGGDGGDLFLRAGLISDIAAHSRFGGLAGPGGNRGAGYASSLPEGGLDGQFGADGAAGSDGFIIAEPVSIAALANGSFDQGLAFFLQSGGGSASIVDLAGDPAAELSTDTTALQLTQLVNTNGAGDSLLLQLEYLFLTPAGTLNVRLDERILLALTATGASSDFGLPAVQSAGGFNRVSLAIADDALLGLSLAQLSLELLPGSLAQVQVDDLSFAVVPEPAALLLIGPGLAALAARRRAGRTRR